VADRATEFWVTFADTFGAPAVEAKYGESPPAIWRASILKLNDFEFARGCRRMLRFRKGVPSLPEFLNLCREVGGEDESGAIAPAFRLTAPSDTDDGRFDQWARIANQKLLRHVMTRTAEEPLRYCPRLANGRPDAAETERLIRPLLEHAHAWASEMRELAASGDLPANGDDARWIDRMKRAEIWINELRSARAA
jgi:hypothetical protein